LVAELRLSAFAARKIIAARDAFLAAQFRQGRVYFAARKIIAARDAFLAA